MTTYFQIQDLLTHPSRWNLDVSNDGDCPLGTLLINTSTLLAAISYISFLLSKWQVYCLLINCRWLSTAWQPFLFSFAKKLNEENRKIYYKGTWYMHFTVHGTCICFGFMHLSSWKLLALYVWVQFLIKTKIIFSTLVTRWMTNMLYHKT